MNIIDTIKEYLQTIGVSEEGANNSFNDSVDISIAICMYAHRNQYRENGVKYHTHPYNCRLHYLEFLGIDGEGYDDDFNEDLLSKLDLPYKGVQETCLLHDVLEDTDVTLQQIEEVFTTCGLKNYFENYIKTPLLLDTHNKSKSYDEYMIEVLKHPTSAMVKLMDLVDNMNVLGLKEYGDKEMERVAKYSRCVRLINDKYHFLEKVNEYRQKVK